MDRHQTSITARGLGQGTPNLTNRKPYRTKEQKEVARATAKKINGRWVSSAPVSYHPEHKG